MTTVKRTILQIMPAEGWRAVYREDDGTLTEYPLVCWALVIEDDERNDRIRYVTGIDAVENQAEFCDEAANFVRYLGPGQTADIAIAEA